MFLKGMKTSQDRSHWAEIHVSDKTLTISTEAQGSLPTSLIVGRIHLLVVV